MFFLPGRALAVSLIDGSGIRGTSRWSWGAIRLRDAVAYSRLGDQQGPSAARVLIPTSAVLTVQVL